MTSDVVLFFITPLFASAGFYFWKHFFSTEVTNALVAVFSIFSGLLLNLLVLLIGIISKVRSQYEEFQKASTPKTRAANAEKNRLKDKLKLLEETYFNLSYAVIISIVSIVTLLFCYTSELLILTVSSFAVVYLTTNFILTLLMILKRVHVILSIEFLND